MNKRTKNKNEKMNENSSVDLRKEEKKKRLNEKKLM